MGGPWLLVAVAVGPCLAILHVVYAVDREREPLRNVLRYFLAGALVVIPVALIEAALLTGARFVPGYDTEKSLWSVALGAFVFIAAIEEIGKRLAVQVCARNDREIGNGFDWLVYSVATAMGFALIENVLYVMKGGISVGVLRALTAVPAHALNGTLMGDRLARATFGPVHGSGLQMRLAVIEPALWHGAYDFLALGIGVAAKAGETARVMYLGIGLFLLIVVQWAVSVVRIARWRRVSGGIPIPPPLYPVEFVRRITTRHPAG